MKKFVAALMTVVLMFSFAISSVAVKKAENFEDVYEFGALNGYQLYSGKNDLSRKLIYFETEINKLSVYGNDTKLYAVVEVVLQSTGATIGGDRAMVTTNQLWTGYNWECHSSTGNNNKVTSYGAHEVRGYNSYVVYTKLVGV